MTDAPNPEYQEVFLDWWSFIVFVGSLVFGFVLGTAKQRWTQEQLQVRVQALEMRLERLEQASGVDSRTLLVLQTELTYIRSSLAEIKQKLEE